MEQAGNSMNNDQFKMLKMYMKAERKVNIFLLTFGLFFLLLTFWATVSDLRALFLTLPPLALILFAIRCIVQNNRLLKQFASIATIQTDEIALSRPKIVFLAYPEMHSRPSAVRRYCGIILKDQQKNKYYYFFDECIRYDGAYFASLKAKFDREIRIQCYENTSIVRTVDNDSRFMRIEYKPLFK